jgi:hypothetical protein
MSQHEVLERKNEILKKSISGMILRDNREGLNDQDSQLMQKFIREYHYNAYRLNASFSK